MQKLRGTLLSSHPLFLVSFDRSGIVVVVVSLAGRPLPWTCLPVSATFFWLAEVVGVLAVTTTLPYYPRVALTSSTMGKGSRASESASVKSKQKPVTKDRSSRDKFGRKICLCRLCNKGSNQDRLMINL